MDRQKLVLQGLGLLAVMAVVIVLGFILLALFALGLSGGIPPSGPMAEWVLNPIILVFFTFPFWAPVAFLIALVLLVKGRAKWAYAVSALPLLLEVVLALLMLAVGSLIE